MRGGRLILKFEAVAHHALVYLNGKKVGEHLGGFEPFEFDVTDLIKMGGENELLVGVTDWIVGLKEGIPAPEAPDKLPPRSMLIPYGTRPHVRRGIWDDAWLCARPPVFVEDVFIRTSVRERALLLELTLRNETERTVRAEVVGDIFDGKRRVLSLPRKRAEIPLRRSAKLTISRSWPKPRLWWPFDFRSSFA